MRANLSFHTLRTFARRHKILLFALLLALILMLYRLDEVDLEGDTNHYASRAVGLADIMFAQRQTTPYRWFETIPWWARISFPPTPLLFLILHVALSLRETVLMVKVPFLFFSLGTIVITYLLIQRLFPEDEGKRFARWSALALALANGLIWAGRNPHLEGGVLFFLMLTLLMFARWLDDEKRWLGFGLALGLALLTKYNALFILPALLGYLLIFHRGRLKKKQFWLAAGAALLLFTPVIIYNAMLWRARGHLDAQFSRLFHLPSPWDLSGAATDRANLLDALLNLVRMNSLPYLLLGGGGLILLWQKHKRAATLLWLYLFFLAVFLFAIGSDPRFLIFFAPLLALGVAVVTVAAAQRLPSIVWHASAIVLGLFFLIYISANQHTLLVEGAKTTWLRSRHRSINYGLSQLDNFLDAYSKKLVAAENLKTFNAGKGIKIKNPWLTRYQESPGRVDHFTALNHILVYDDAIHWFARQWLFERRTFYHNLPLYSPKIIAELQALFGGDKDEKVYHLIKATEQTLIDPQAPKGGIAATLEELLISKEVEPALIYRSDGQVAFKIYRFEGAFGFDLKKE